MGALLGEAGGGGGSFAGGSEGYERKALRTDVSLHGGSVGQPGVGNLQWHNVHTRFHKIGQFI